MHQVNVLCLAVAVALSIGSVQAAGPRTGTSSTPSRSVLTSLTPKQRGAAIAQFVRKWGPYVENVYAVDVHSWSQKMVGQFAVGDAGNIQRALQRDTFEGAMAELDGVGHRLSDERVITKLASASSPDVIPAALGDIDKDLVYTTVTPCRIVDTRLAGGQVASTPRIFALWGVSSYTFQGGSATNCGMQNQHPTSAVFNVTAVTPSGAGYATVYSGALSSPPLVASINYTAGAIVNNTVLTDINPATSPDFKIWSYASSHFVVDLVGYYDNPYATPLDCVNLNNTVAVASGAIFDLLTPTCAAAYKMTGAGCQAGFDEVTWAINGLSRSEISGSCSGRNVSGGFINVGLSTRCCRVPGR